MTNKRPQDINIAMVGYYNTLPFLYGLNKNENFKLILDIPSRCMDYYSKGEADIALVPVATLLDRDDYTIVTDYCIGCIGSVRTVCLFTNVELSAVTKIYLDKDSRTSQLLTKTLCERQWNIEPSFEECNVRNLDTKELASNEAVLMIGDKVFGQEDSFLHCFDLGVEWQQMTGMPFAFAVWIARKDVPESTITALNHALGQGIQNIDAVLKENQELATKIDLSEYFNNYIDYYFDSKKENALNLFFDYNKVFTS